MTLHSMEQIKSLNEQSGRFFFAPRTMRFFKSRVSSTVYPCLNGEAIFVTSERDLGGDRWYSVRLCRVSGDCLTHPATLFKAYKRKEAHRMAKRLSQFSPV